MQLGAQGCFKGNINQVTFSPHLSLRTRVVSATHSDAKQRGEALGSLPFFFCVSRWNHISSVTTRELDKCCVLLCSWPQGRLVAFALWASP